MRIVLALIALPLIEIALFVQTGRWLGLWAVLGLVVASGLGGLLVLSYGRAGGLRDIQRAIETERDPSGPLGHAALRMLGGVMLVMPGFLTDALGLLLMLPAMRGLALRRMQARVATVHARAHARAHTTHARGSGHGGRPDVIDADYEVLEPHEDSPWRGRVGGQAPDGSTNDGRQTGSGKGDNPENRH